MTVDTGRPLEPDSLHRALVLIADPERCLPPTEVLDVKRHGASRSTNRQLKLGFEMRHTNPVRNPSPEADLGVVLDVEEVRVSQMGVAAFQARCVGTREASGVGFHQRLRLDSRERSVDHTRLARCGRAARSGRDGRTLGASARQLLLTVPLANQEQRGESRDHTERGRY